MSDWTKELKPCPFCGEPATSFYDEINNNFKLDVPRHKNMCPLAGITVFGSYRSRMDLFEAWNTRQDTLSGIPNPAEWMEEMKDLISLSRTEENYRGSDYWGRVAKALKSFPTTPKEQK